MRKLTGLLISAAVLSAGCGKKPPEAPPSVPAVVEKAPAPAPATPTPAAPEVKPAEPTPAVPAPAPATPEAKPAAPAPAVPAQPKPLAKLKKADQVKATEAYKEFRALLDEGRKAVKADDPMTGMKKLEAALTKVPGHPSALGELGWAAYRAGAAYWDMALDSTRKAIAVSKKNKQKGALWYNLGRIAEDQGNLDLALNSYRSSLAFRPGNDTVQKQLEGVVARLGGKSAEDGLAKLDDACGNLIGEWGCETVTSAEGFVQLTCACTTEIIGPEEGFGKAALMRIAGYAEAGGSVDAVYLLIEIAAKWHVVTMVGNSWNPGFGYVSNSAEQKRFQFREVASAGGPKKVLWVEFDNSSRDLDPGVYTEYNDSSRTVTLCDVTDGKPSCWNVPLASMSETAALSFEEDNAIPEGEGPKNVGKTEWSFKTDVNGAGEIVISSDEGTPDDELAKLPGSYTISTIGSAPGVVKLEF